MMAAALGGAWDVGCRRFQRRWIDRLTTIQVGGSSTKDESPELVAIDEGFFLRKFPKNLPFIDQRLALGFDTM